MTAKMLHTCLRVENLEASIAFYKEAFGFKELRRKDFPEYAFTIVYLITKIGRASCRERV